MTARGGEQSGRQSRWRGHWDSNDLPEESFLLDEPLQANWGGCVWCVQEERRGESQSRFCKWSKYLRVRIRYTTTHNACAAFIA